MREQALTAMTFRRLGIEPRKNPDSHFCASQVLEVLGPRSFAEVTAVRTSGKVIWCNFDLARQLGFDVPRSNQLTQELHEQLLASLSLRVVGPTEDVRGQEITTMYADKYGGDGVGPALGAGRAGFLPYGNIYVKGIGFTPLFKHNNPGDFAHSHGAVHLLDCLSEAIFGEANANLFTNGSSRVVAIIDDGKYVTDPHGLQIAVGLVVRAGAQLRPAHLLGSRGRRGYLLNKFVKITRATGQLVNRRDQETGDDLPDMKSTMLRVIDAHARTAAEGFRWRMLHGALSSSNMEMSGAMLDLPTQSSQPRTAPIRSLPYSDSTFGTEHIERASKLMTVYRTLMRNTPPTERDLFNVALINFAGEMKQAYNRHLQVNLIGAAGLKTAVARRIQDERADLAVRFSDHILQMAALKNPGTTCTWKSVVESVSVLDVFHLLKSLPHKYFSNPDADHTNEILHCLRPIYIGNRFHVAKKQAVVSTLVSKFADLYRELMDACSSYARSYYGDLDSMHASIVARAAFENEPLDSLYARRLCEEINKTIEAYRSTANAAIIREAIDMRVAGSVRSVDALLIQGDSRRLIGGGIELEMRTIAGVNYSVRAWNDKEQTRQLHISIPVERKDNHYLNAVPNLGPLTKHQIGSLRYRFTTDAWKSSAEAKSRLTNDKRDGLVIEFDQCGPLPLVGRLDGAFYVCGTDDLRSKHLRPTLGGYVFAIPDKEELITMVEGVA